MTSDNVITDKGRAALSPQPLALTMQADARW